jgi:hypothetical protein
MPHGAGKAALRYDGGDDRIATVTGQPVHWVVPSPWDCPVTGHQAGSRRMCAPRRQRQ